MKNNYFLQEDNRQKAIDLAEYLEEHIAEDELSPYIYNEFLAEHNTVDKVLGKVDNMDRR